MSIRNINNIQIKTIVSLIVNDFRNIFRDDILKVLLFVPVMMILLIRFGLPALVNLLPELQEYCFLIVALFGLVIASFPAFIISFIMLDEKDEGIFIMYKVLPMSDVKFFIYRLGFLICFSFFYSILLLVVQMSIILNWWQVVLAALLFSFLPPAITLLTVTFARNKIEGVTLMKFLNFILFLPVAGFFVPVPWKFIFGVIPVFWSFRVLEVMGQNTTFLLSFAIGTLLHGLLLWLIFRIFIKRT
ncbi:MAG: hypothetical protein JXB00_00015 [Bacteroidales bacterium]|nr:hypothetical protein [Bacteroidales bacterium]